MYKILLNTPFGFVFELNTPGRHFADAPYTLYIDGQEERKARENTVAVFGLKPDTSYGIRAEQTGGTLAEFEVRTEKAGYVINVRDYNASGNGEADDTSAVNAAIYTAPAHSVIYVPPGTYLVNQVFLKSGVDIYLEKGATLIQNTTRESLAAIKGFQRNYDNTAFTVNAMSQGSPLDTFCSLIYGKDVSDVRIYGEGTLDGNGDKSGFWKHPTEKIIAYRPRNVFLCGCSRISISGITSRNSAAWNMHPFYCSHMDFFALRIESDPSSPNTDGINPESCDHVNIIGCKFQTGDDCIAIKSGKYFMSRSMYKPSEDITVRNCHMSDGHGGVVLGSEISSGVKNVLVEKCLFEGTDRGLRIKTRRGRGSLSVVDGVIFKEVTMVGVRHCFVINMYYNCDPDGKSDYVQDKTARPVDESTPSIKNISLSGVECEKITGSAVFIYGLPESKVCHVSVKDSRFSFANERVTECPAMMEGFDAQENLGVFVENASDVELSGNSFDGEHTVYYGERQN